MPLKNLSLSTIAGLTLGLLLVGYTVLAWSVPTQPAPNGNTPAPLNTGTADQIKTGGTLTLQGDIVSENKTIWGDDVNLGAGDPGKKIAVCGDLVLRNQDSLNPMQKIALHACDGLGNLIALFDNSGTQQIALNPQDKTITAGIVTVKGDGTISPGLNSSKLQDLDAASLMAAGGSGGGGGGSYVAWGTSSCAVGWTSAYTGYTTSSVVKSTSLGTFSASSLFCKAGPASSTYPASNELIQYFSQGNQYTGLVGTVIPCTMCVISQPVSIVARAEVGSTVLYTTKAGHNGNMGGRNGADGLCASALPPPLSGHARNIHAFLSVDGTDEIRDMHTSDSDNDNVAKSWYETYMPIYVYNREWSEFNIIATTWKDLLDGQIRASLDNTRDRSYTPFHYWTGSAALGYATDTCDGWTAEANNKYGDTGNSNYADSQWLNWRNIYTDPDTEVTTETLPNCNVDYKRLVCAMQYQ